MKHNKYRSTSRKKTPWDKSKLEDLTELEKFISNTFKNNYDSHHPNLIIERQIILRLSS